MLNYDVELGFVGSLGVPPGLEAVPIMEDDRRHRGAAHWLRCVDRPHRCGCPA